ncbi:MAG TPA: EAL domain-containing protein [Solirubrobacteraceae bacterium]|jgi:EAL domain-containing protein (putative c-di-GMP-specific phosphodiesterase class I)|nr:EAL domain-containing protein [Solirubrobacteraceae bacterium]
MPVTVCACLGVLTAIAAVTADEQAHSEARMRRAALSARASAQVAEVVGPTIERLQDLAAATGQDRPGSLAGFDAVAAGLLEDPAMNGVGLIELVPARARAAFERAHGQIKALHNGGPSGRAPQRSRYYVVADVLSRPGQPRNIDMNIGEDPVRHTVLVAAARSGKPQATPPVHRVNSREFVTALYVPVYRPTHQEPATPSARIADLQGFVSSGYRYAQLAPGVRAALPRGTTLTLYDGRSKLLSAGVPHDAQRTSISVAGRSWVLAVGEPAANLSLTKTVIIVGGLLTLLLVALSVQATRRERYALEMVDRRLAEREQAELALRQLTANDPLGPARIETRLEWVQRIRAALDEGRLALYAQPVVETATRRTTQHELLVRMIDTDGSLVSPAQFLPIAERFGLIREIDRWVVTETIAILRRQREVGLRPTVEINLSGHSLGDTGLAADIGSQLRDAQVDPDQLVFEVTETTAIGNIAAARDFAQQLARLGCRFALDDFGAGFGSFYYLKHLPFDYIKIDGEFVRNCTVDVTDRLVIRAVVKLAQGMGTRTIAEFVGDEKTFATVAALGVDYAQGFHLGKPAPVESMLGLPSSQKQ